MKSVVYVSDISIYKEEDVFEEAYEMLPPDRKEKTDQFKFFDSKAACVGSYILLMKAFANEGIDIEGLVFSYKENGKPYFKEYEDICFNISHSGQKAMCILSERDAGCDVQIMTDKVLHVDRKMLTEDERKLLENLSDKDEIIDLLIKIWTKKESFIKATGEGLKRALSSFSTIDESFDDYYFHEFDLNDGYKYAAVIKDEKEIPALVLC